MEIGRERYGGGAAEELVRASLAEIASRYGGRGGSGPEPDPAEFEPPHGVFLIGYVDGRAVACGGLARYDETTGEIRRMYVSPDARGRGLSRRIVAALEEEARELGYTAIRLETGNRQAEALGLYRSSGYEPIPRYGPYVDDEISVCLEKRL